MDKTLTLQPFCITEGSGFEGIIGSNKKANISIAANVSMHVGFIGFTYDALHKKSSACVFKNLQVHFWQSGGDLAWLNWELTPFEASDFSVQGTRLISHTDNLIGFPQKTGSHDLDKWYEQRYDFKNANAPTDLFSSNMVVLRVDASNDAKLMPQTLWMRDLELTLKYTARYYARFYADNKLKITQTVEANKRATPPDVTAPDGYRLAGWKCGNSTYAANDLPTSEDTDLRFDAVWERIYYKVTLPKTGTASCRVTDANGSSTYNKSKDTDTTEKVTVAHGDSIKVYASGFNTRAQNLLVKVNGGTAAEKDGSSGGEVLIYEGAVTGELTFSISLKTVTFPITISKTGSGETDAPASAVRYASATVKLFANIGNYIQSLTIDETAIALQAGATYYEHTFRDVSDGHSIAVVFAVSKVPVSFHLVGAPITVEDENGNDVSEGTEVDYGSEHSFTFRVAEEYSLDQVIDTGNETLLDAFEQVREFTVDAGAVVNAATYIASAVGALFCVEIEQTTGGTVQGYEGKFIRGKGSLEYTCVPDQYYALTEWFNGDTSQRLVVETDKLTADLVVSAAFGLKQIKIDAVIKGIDLIIYQSYHGSFAEDKFVKNLYLSAAASEEVEIPFFPDEGYVIDYVLQKSGSSSQRIYPESNSITIQPTGEEEDQRIKLEFYFKIGKWTARVSAKYIDKNGNICSDFVGNSAFIYGVYSGQSITYNVPFIVTAFAAAGWHLLYWSDNPSNSSTMRTIKMPGRDFETYAIFKKDQKKITVEAGEGGEATPGVIVEYGDDFLLEITADIGQKIADVVLDGVSIYDDVTLTRRGGRYLLQNITEHHTIKVTFAAKTYTNGRRLFDYWPPVIQRIRDMQEIARVQQPMIDELWDSVSWLMENQFIDSATEEAVILWEKELGIVPNASDTLRQRKARLKIKWVPHNRFTVSWLHEWLCSATGRNDIQWPYVPENTYGLLVHLPVETNWQAIYRDLELYKPCNIYLDPHVDMPHNELRILTGFAVVSKRRCEIKDEHQMEREEGL